MPPVAPSSPGALGTQSRIEKHRPLSKFVVVLAALVLTGAFLATLVVTILAIHYVALVIRS